MQHHSIELKLRFDTFDDVNQETKQQILVTNEKSHIHSILELIELIDSVPLASIDLSNVQKIKFEKLFFDEKRDRKIVVPFKITQG